MAKNKQQHQEDVRRTLRELIFVQPLPNNATAAAGVFVTNPDFWDRCQLVNPNWRQESSHPSTPHRIYVDGFVQGCNWNSMKVFNDHLEEGLRVYQGYALGGGAWSEHCWVMRGDRIVETCGEFTIYYGTALNEQELETLNDLAAQWHHTNRIWTVSGGERVHSPYVVAEHAAGIGRERNPVNREIKPGLGR